MSVDRPRWTPDATSNRTQCRNCGEPVLAGTARVFGDRNNVLHHCGACLSHRDLHHGAGAMAEYDPETHRDKDTASHRNPIFGGDDA